MVDATDAVALGMPDKVGTLVECLAALVGKPSGASRQAAHAAPAVQVDQAADRLEINLREAESRTTSETVPAIIDALQKPVPVKDDLEISRRRQRPLGR